MGEYTLKMKITSKKGFFTNSKQKKGNITNTQKQNYELFTNS